MSDLAVSGILALRSPQKGPQFMSDFSGAPLIEHSSFRHVAGGLRHVHTHVKPWNLAMHPALSMLLVSLGMLCIVPPARAHTQFEVVPDPPVLVKTQGEMQVLRFGPMTLTLPAAWLLKRTGLVHEYRAGEHARIFIGVMRTSAAARSQGYSPAMAMETNRQALARTMADLCSENSSTKVEDLPPVKGRPILVGYCSEISKMGVSGYYVQYQIHSERTLVQVSVGGNGLVEEGRRLLEPVLLTQVWQDEP